jgi:hypothetical protein
MLAKFFLFRIFHAADSFDERLPKKVTPYCFSKKLLMKGNRFSSSRTLFLYGMEVGGTMDTWGPSSHPLEELVPGSPLGKE